MTQDESPKDALHAGSPAGERPGTKPGVRRAIPTRVVCLILIGVVAMIVTATYWPVLSAQACSFDDDEYLADADLVRELSWRSVRRAFTEVLNPTVAGYYEPLSVVSLMIDYALGGRLENLRPFHRTNLVLHAANTALVIMLIYLLFGQPWAAAMAGLLFGLHPLTVESVALAAQRKALLAPFFSLVCLVLYVQYARRGRPALLAGSVLTYLAALLSKPTSVPLPAVLLLLDFWPLWRLMPLSVRPEACTTRRVLLEKTPFFVLAAVFAAITVISTGRTAEIAVPGQAAAVRIPLTMAYLVCFYPLKTLWPVNLSPVYMLPQPLSLANPVVAAAAAGALLLVAVLALSLRWTRAFLTGWLVFFVVIFPTLGIISYSWVTAADKYMYLPLLGFLLPAAWLMQRWWESTPAVLTVPCRRIALVLVVLAAASAEGTATRRYLTTWQDTETHFRRMIRLTPDSPYPHNYLGVALYRKGRTEDAIRHYREAVRLAPDNAYAHNNLATALYGQGQAGREQLDEALFHYLEAARCGMVTAPNETLIAAMLAERGKFDQALPHLRQALRLDPGFADARYVLGNILLVQGDLDGAIEQYSAAVRTSPDFTEARFNLGLALLRRGRAQQAAQQFRDVLRIEPGHPGAREQLAKLAGPSSQAPTTPPKAEPRPDGGM